MFAEPLVLFYGQIFCYNTKKTLFFEHIQSKKTTKKGWLRGISLLKYVCSFYINSANFYDSLRQHI